jgi:hypothetical protein
VLNSRQRRRGLVVGLWYQPPFVRWRAVNNFFTLGIIDCLVKLTVVLVTCRLCIYEGKSENKVSYFILSSGFWEMDFPPASKEKMTMWKNKCSEVSNKWIKRHLTVQSYLYLLAIKYGTLFLTFPCISGIWNIFIFPQQIIVLRGRIYWQVEKC